MPEQSRLGLRKSKMLLIWMNNEWIHCRFNMPRWNKKHDKASLETPITRTSPEDDSGYKGHGSTPRYSVELAFVIPMFYVPPRQVLQDAQWRQLQEETPLHSWNLHCFWIYIFRREERRRTWSELAPDGRGHKRGCGGLCTLHRDPGAVQQHHLHGLPRQHGQGEHEVRRWDFQMYQ